MENVGVNGKEEIELFLAVRRGLRARKVLEQLDGRGYSLPDSLRRYWSEMVRAGERAEEELLRRNMPLVYKMILDRAPWLAGNPHDYAEYVQEGALGLLWAIRLFDPSRGYRFSTFAYAWIRICIRRVFRGGAFLNQKFLRKEVVEFLSLVDSGLEVEEARLRVGLSREAAMEAYRALRGTVSLNSALYAEEDTGKELQDVLSAEDGEGSAMELEERVERIGDLQLLSWLLENSGLTPREKRVVVEFIKSGSSPNLRVVSEKLGVGVERARQLLRSAIQKMRSCYLDSREELEFGVSRLREGGGEANGF